jgi:hypothetical protein
LFLGFTIAVPNDDEDLTTGKNLKSVMERLYLLASKGSGINKGGRERIPVNPIGIRFFLSNTKEHFLIFNLVETMQRLLPEKSISLMVYLHANNRSLIVEIDREVLESITK